VNRRRDGPVVVTLRALGLGDLLTVVPALRAIRRAFPDHHHVLLTAPQLEPLVAATGAVDELVPVRGLARVVSDPTWPPAVSSPEIAIDLHGRGPQSHRLLLDLRPRALVAFSHDDVAASAAGPPWDQTSHEVHRWCGLLDHFGIPADPLDLALAPPLAAERAPVTVIHPGAASGSRRWPVERFAAVARIEHERGHPVVVTGTAAEAALVAAVVDQAGLPARADRSRTSLAELMELVASAGRLLCGDTGVAHLATAYGTPSVVLFGPVSPEQWGPPPHAPQHVALWAGHLGDPHGDAPDPGLLEIEVGDVLAALEAVGRRRDNSPIGGARPASTLRPVGNIRDRA
jgi:ADP-heptose:LPS heptosyltransferase